MGLELGGLRYAGVFGFVGAAFGVVLGMTTFFVTQHYADLREAAQSEATGLGNIAAMTGSFPARDGLAIRRQIYCYATEVIDQEWPNMVDDENGSTIVERREGAVYLTLLKTGRPAVPKPTNWYTNAVASALDSAQDRQKRLLLSQPEIPNVLWFLVYVGAGLIILFAYFFHRESPRQMLGMFAAVLVMLTAVIGTLAGLDAPTEDPIGLQPHAMEAEQELLGEAVHADVRDPEAFCRTVPTPNAAEVGL